MIGNPPYIRIQTMQEWAPQEVEYYKDRYISAGKGNYDIYVVFVERGLGLLNPNGRLGFILPNKFSSTDYGAGLRGLLHLKPGAWMKLWTSERTKFLVPQHIRASLFWRN